MTLVCEEEVAVKTVLAIGCVPVNLGLLFSSYIVWDFLGSELLDSLTDAISKEC